MRHPLILLCCLALLGCDKASPDQQPATNASDEHAAESTNSSGDAVESEPETTGAAKPVERKIEFERAASVPDNVEVKGKTVQSARFTDSKGDNLVVLSETDSPDLHAVHFLIGEDGTPEVVREVKQVRGECEFDYSAEFVDGSLGVTDKDGDEVGEITFAYKFTCTSDVSPKDYKVVVLEGGEKSILRGSEVILFPGDDTPLGDGKFEPEGFDGKPGLLEHAEKVWKRNVMTQY